MKSGNARVFLADGGRRCRVASLVLFLAPLLLGVPGAVEADELVSMVAVPGGQIQLQSVTATLSDFSVGAYEVTAEQFVTVYNWALDQGKFPIPRGAELKTAISVSGQPCFDLDNRWSYVKFADGRFAVDPQYASYPALAVSWYGAAAFCNFLSEMEELDPVYNLTDFSCDFSANGYRLPTFAEWEYAARYRGPGLFRDKNEYSGSADIAEVAWYDQNSAQQPNASAYDGTRTHPVGSLEPNELGIYDMSGNVNEWLWDWHHGSYRPEGNDPRGPDHGSYRMVRGGSWLDPAYMCRVGRFKNAPPASFCGFSSCDLGFRIARSN